MPNVKIDFEHVKSTKNKERYREVRTEGPPAIGDLYLARWLFPGDDIPNEVSLTLALPGD